jgi:serine/threonine protein kinase
MFTAKMEEGGKGREVDPALLRYQLLDKLGEGTYANVFKGRDTETNAIVALKIMKLDCQEEGIPSTTLREMSILRSVSHVNILTLRDVSARPGHLMLVFDYLQSDLRKLLISKGFLSVDECRCFGFQLLCGLYVLHSHRVMHRDIKPDNLLLDEQNRIKICYFGLARYFTLPMRQYSPNVVTTRYRAPELIFGTRPYGLEIDVWSVGCVLAEMVLGFPLFNGDCPVNQIQKFFEILGRPSEEDAALFGDTSGFPAAPVKDLATLLPKDEYLVDLVKKMLIYNPEKRITVKDALFHPFFHGISQELRDMSWPTGFK